LNAAHSDANGPATIDSLLDLGSRLRRWGTWGPNDEKGALNFITPERRAYAATLVRRGQVFSLALPIRSGRGPMRGSTRRFNPVHLMTATGDASSDANLGGGADITDDLLIMPLQSTTQWDALCHVYYEDTLYNGYPAATVGVSGASRNGIGVVHSEFVGRGILLDVARLHGVDCLSPCHAITSAELESCENTQGVRVEEGDLLLVRTGQMSKVQSFEDWSVFHGRQAGLHYQSAEWLAERRVAAVAADNSAVEALEQPISGAETDLPTTDKTHVINGVRVPLHMLALRDLGIHLGEYWYLEELAADCAKDGVYEFLLVAQAMPIEGGAGSPVNPVAMK
jgi:kynurenine formamidase